MLWTGRPQLMVSMKPEHRGTHRDADHNTTVTHGTLALANLAAEHRFNPMGRPRSTPDVAS
jgi:hypothetical protein